MRAFLIRSAFTGFALWIATLIVPGLDFVYGDNPTTLEQIGVVVFVSLVFGLVNGFIKPIVQILSIPLYILTLGLIHIAINAFMLEITAWITRNTTHWGLQVDSFFWSAIWGAIVISIVGWGIDMLLKEPVR
ncbi:phage holin family protein [Gordonia sp. NPDC003424]